MAKILIIEDDSYIRENVAETLELESYEVLAAENGRIGVDLAQHYLPDLIICDIMMDELDGYGVLEALSADPTTAAIPFIFLTARADRPSMRQGMQLGADDYITKPFSPDELLQAISARLERVKKFEKHTEEKLEASKQHLLSLITDELHTPLTSINKVMDIISRQLGFNEPQEVHELLDIISQGSKRLNRVVQQIALLARLEIGDLEYDEIVRAGNVRQVWDLLITAPDLARSFIPDRSDVHVRIDERDEYATIICDPGALKHALAELISNAIYNTPAAGEVVMSQWRSQDAVWISIADSGSGIPDDVLQTVFEGNAQVKVDDERQSGIGLGLLLARRIVEVHGGQLDIKTALGRGTQASFSLPIVDD